MRASRGMGCINPTKVPGAKKKAEGGAVGPLDKLVKAEVDFGRVGKANKKLGKKEGGSVNAAGNYTKPTIRKSIVAQVKAAATHGTGAGQWSARKAQLMAKRYKAAGGGYK